VQVGARIDTKHRSSSSKVTERKKNSPFTPDAHGHHNNPDSSTPSATTRASPLRRRSLDIPLLARHTAPAQRRPNPLDALPHISILAVTAPVPDVPAHHARHVLHEAAQPVARRARVRLAVPLVAVRAQNVSVKRARRQGVAGRAGGRRRRA